MYMTERFGCWQIGNDATKGKVRFRIFFPDRNKDASQYDMVGGRPQYGDPEIKKIQVVGTFQVALGGVNWDLATAPALLKKPHAKGVIWEFETPAELPKGFYEYKYLVTFNDNGIRLVGDPCARYGGSEEQNSGIAVGGSDPAVDPFAERKHLRDLIQYELMIDDFTDEFRRNRAPLDAVRDKLDHIERLGVNAILFMPWTAWPGEGFNWGYNPYQYFSVEYRYANTFEAPEEKLSWLVHLINECHLRKIHVIMDGVFNHVGDAALSGSEANGFPYRWLYRDPHNCPYVGQFGGTFSGLEDLNFNNGCTQEFIRDVCFYWMDEFRIDGIRFDNTTNFYIGGTNKGLPKLLADIEAHVTSKGERNFSLILEHLSLEAANVTNSTAATSYWNNELYARCFDYLWSGQIDSRIMGALENHRGLNLGKVATTYMGNHDHSHVAWQAGARSNAGALQWYRTQPYAIALITAPGSPMVQNGQEFAEDYWIMEDDRSSNRRVKPRPLRWDFAGDNIGRPLGDVYRKLIAIRREHPGLRSDNFYPTGWQDWMTEFNGDGYGARLSDQIVIYHRWGPAADGALERFIVAINFSGEDKYSDIPVSAPGKWRDLLNDVDFTVTGFSIQNQKINSNWGRILYLKS